MNQPPGSGACDGHKKVEHRRRIDRRSGARDRARKAVHRRCMDRTRRRRDADHEPDRRNPDARDWREGGVTPPPRVMDARPAWAGDSAA
jgi:hypothetical protein